MSQASEYRLRPSCNDKCLISSVERWKTKGLKSDSRNESYDIEEVMVDGSRVLRCICLEALLRRYCVGFLPLKSRILLSAPGTIMWDDSASHKYHVVKLLTVFNIVSHFF